MDMHQKVTSISKNIEENSSKQQNSSNTKNQHNIVKHGLETIKRGLKFLWKDLRTKHLIWVKVVFFLQSASLVTLYPYLVSK